MKGPSLFRLQPLQPRQTPRSMTLTFVASAIGFIFVAQPLFGQDRARYRDFQLGSDVTSVSALAHLAASDAKTIHQRPAVMQELEWRPRFASGASAAQVDPVRQIVFSFYDDQLSKLVIDYDRDRTAGMTDADMIDGISATYGLALIPSSRKAPALAASRLEEDSGTPVARWGDAGYSVVLYRSNELYQSPSSSARFRVIVASPRLDALAQIADAQAVLLDTREAPQRELAKQKKAAEDTRTAGEKARLANKAAFRP